MKSSVNRPTGSQQGAGSDQDSSNVEMTLAQTATGNQVLPMSAGEAKKFSFGRDVRRIIPGVVDRNAFFDTVVVSIWGQRRQRPPKDVQRLGNPAIGGKGRN